MQDMPALLAMCAAMHAESPRFNTLVYSEEKMYNLIEQLINSPNLGGVLVAEQEGQLVGMFGYVIVAQFFGPDTMATDIGMYVKPEFRGGGAFVKLVIAFENAAKDVTEFMLGVSTGIHSEKTAGMLERLGYDRIGISLRKRNK
jgi:GNAT superfamily N-acetyltransferase